MFGRKYRYDFDAEYEENENGLNAALPPPAPVTRADYVLAAVLGVLTTVFAWLLFPAGLHPSAWIDCAQAAGLRPPADLFPGIWRVFAHALYSAFGVGAAGRLIALGGKISLGLIAAMGYLSFRALLALLIRKLPSDGFWNHRLARAVSLLAAFALACSDPIWMVCQAFTAQTFLVLLFVLMTMLWIRFFRDGKLSAAYAAMAVTGVFASETPLGFLLLIVFWLLYVLLLRHGFLVQVELVNLFVKQNSKWYLTFCCAAGFLFGVTANVLGFIAFDGLAANGLSLGDLPLRYAVRVWGQTVSAASAGGWIIGSGLALMPFVLVLALVHRATDVEHFLKYQVGLVFFGLACVSYSQLASLQPLWFWTWIKAPVMVKSPLLLSVFAFMSAVSFLCSLAVLGVDAYCRNNRRLAQQLDPESVTDESAESSGRGFFRAVALVFLFALLVAGLVPGRIQPTTGRMLSIMRDYVREIVTEAGDAKWLFTDGAYDCAVELESARRGGNLVCISLLPGPAARSIHACQRTLPDQEDRLSAEVGGPNLLRTWERDKPGRLADSAFQLGFELWRRSGKAYPSVAGVLARADGAMPADGLDAAIRRGYVLAERVLSLYADGGPTPRAGRQVNDLFLFLQWRLARLARIRAEIFDTKGDTVRSLEEVRFSDSLDDRNASLKRIIDGMTRLKELTMRQMTPREGLQFALVRADFALARRYAEPILDADPDDPNANFGMGMSYFMEEQWGRAEEYLNRCLRRNEKEPAIWNNIAVLQLRTGRLEEARKNALKALELIPGSAEVKDTLAQIEKAIKAAQTNGIDKVSAPAKKATK